MYKTILETRDQGPWPWMGHTHSFQISGWGYQILPWSWESRSRRGISSENHVWDGQNGAASRRRTPLSFPLHRTAGINLRLYVFPPVTFGLGWANEYMPKSTGGLGENQSGHWDDSCDAKRSSSASPNRPQIWATVWRFNIHSARPEFLPRQKIGCKVQNSRNVNRSQVEELVLRPKEKTAQACSGCATVNRLGDLCGIPPPCCPSWLSYDTSWERGESDIAPRRRLWAPGSSCARRGTLLSKHCAPVCLRIPHPSLFQVWRRYFLYCSL